MDDSTRGGGIETAKTATGWHPEDRGAGGETGRPNLINDVNRAPFVSSVGADVLGSLSLCERLSGQLTPASADWKWCLLSARAALRGCLVLLLAKDNTYAIFTPESLANADKDWEKTAETVEPALVAKPFKSLFFAATAAKEDRKSQKPLRLEKHEVFSIIQMDEISQALLDLIPVGGPIREKPSRLASGIATVIDIIGELKNHPSLREDPDLGPAIRCPSFLAMTLSIRGNMARFI